MFTEEKIEILMHQLTALKLQAKLAPASVVYFGVEETQGNNYIVR